MSNQNQHIKNTFEKGMWRDSHASYQPPGTYRFSMNAIHETDQYTSSENDATFLTQEHALKSVVTLPGKPVGKGFVESRDWLIFFLDNNEIGYVNLKTHEYH